jgi:hypothetical protein
VKYGLIKHHLELLNDRLDESAAYDIRNRTCNYRWNMKEIRFSDHAQLKMEVLASHKVIINADFVVETVRSPDKLETGEEDKLIAQKNLDENLVLRVVYREFSAFILIITLYPGRRSRYEKN